MIRLFVFSLLAIVIALWVTLYLGFPSDPGYLLIAFGNYTFETSLFALLVALAVIYLVLRLLLLLLQWLNPMTLLAAGRVMSRNRKAKKRSHTIEGLLSFTRGNWSTSLNQLKRGMRDNDASVVNYLAAAYAAFQIGDKEGWVSLLEQAGKKHSPFHHRFIEGAALSPQRSARTVTGRVAGDEEEFGKRCSHADAVEGSLCAAGRLAKPQRVIAGTREKQGAGR